MPLLWVLRDHDASQTPFSLESAYAVARVRKDSCEVWAPQSAAKQAAIPLTGFKAEQEQPQLFCQMPRHLRRYRQATSLTPAALQLARYFDFFSILAQASRS